MNLTFSYHNRTKWISAVEQKIEDLVKKQTRLQKKDHQGTITDEEAFELAKFINLRASHKSFQQFS